jgi:dihydrodipicolinate synthase/N-acetylneuraminate lyase
MNVIEGIVPVIPVPFHPDETIDEAGLRNLVDFCVAGKAAAICLPAYGSEFYKLSEQERLDVVRIAAGQAAGRVPVAGQANHPSPRVAIDLARRMQELGASIISMAAPRVFALGEEDLLRYFRAVCREIRVPLLIQDFNPGGPTVGADFARRLHADCPNFRYLKLEEPMMGPKVRAIREATGGQVGVLEGWGGLYMMELIPTGICGAMPGVPLLRVLHEVYWKRKQGQDAEALADFQSILPFIVFELEHLELFLHVEKRLLKAMGLIASPTVREATIQLDPDTEAYAEWLIAQVLPIVT